MPTQPAIVVDSVSKTFRLRGGGTRTLKAAALDALLARRSVRHFEALTDVSFAVPKGETLGIIGANGAGKSTLLGLVAGAMAPTRGAIRTDGTISSLLELGAGFHPDLSGRENVFLYGAVIGITRKKMRVRYAAILEFAGIGEYIDQPVKRYSSGMYARLAFAVAVEVDPDVLLIDEVLAVGDAAFQRKCLQKMRDFRRQGKTMLMVSHDLATIQSVSDRILLLDGGRVVGLGGPESVVNAYRSLAGRQGADGLAREWGAGEARIASVEFFNDRGEPATTFEWGGGLAARIRYEASRRIEKPVFGFALSDSAGRLIYGSNTQIEGFAIPWIEGQGTLRLRIPKLVMANGSYLLSFSLHSEDHRTNYHRLDHRFPIAVVGAKGFEGPCHMPCEWRAG
ncbi:MAG: ABC transporter ATP-binding protein [Verrucomicrobiota bacterium]|nr:ABC transporter ATP-binding protein [Verrucomicrobiota bacterium]